MTNIDELKSTGLKATLPRLKIIAAKRSALAGGAVAPAPPVLLAIARGLSQGRMAAAISGVASGTGILFHVATASLGLTLLMQTSAVAFWVVKVIGASYLVWLGIKVLRSRSLINFKPAARQSLKSIFLTGFLSAALNPKPGPVSYTHLTLPTKA